MAVTEKPAGIHYVHESDLPLVMTTDDGGVMLSVSVDLALRFRTRESFDRWLQDTTRGWINP